MFCKVHSLSKFANIMMNSSAKKFWWWQANYFPRKDQKAIA